jgi:hypothetical protein
MKYKDILSRIAPCGISCEKCFAFRSGKIRENSIALAESLGNFRMYAGRFAELLDEPVFNTYPYFQLVLDYFREVDCKGCRKEHCKIFKSCKVRECIDNRGVDFCFQCPDFPCRDTGFDDNLEQRWKENNVKMKETGVEDYYNDLQHVHRYP